MDDEQIEAGQVVLLDLRLLLLEGDVAGGEFPADPQDRQLVFAADENARHVNSASGGEGRAPRPRS
ncbi:MAG: hypothetical protein MZU97_10280 [Bacillus subtilis]|nr:hypothetical protein [Bacillus subtilis]